MWCSAHTLQMQFSMRRVCTVHAGCLERRMLTPTASLPVSSSAGVGHREGAGGPGGAAAGRAPLCGGIRICPGEPEFVLSGRDYGALLRLSRTCHEWMRSLFWVFHDSPLHLSNKQQSLPLPSPCHRPRLPRSRRSWWTSGHFASFQTAKLHTFFIAGRDCRGAEGAGGQAAGAGGAGCGAQGGQGPRGGGQGRRWALVAAVIECLMERRC